MARGRRRTPAQWVADLTNKKTSIIYKARTNIPKFITMEILEAEIAKLGFGLFITAKEVVVVKANHITMKLA